MSPARSAALSLPVACLAALLGALVSGAPQRAHAQYLAPGAPPTFGGGALTGGPLSLRGTAGGPVSLGDVDGRCRGYAQPAPNHVVSTPGGVVRFAVSAGFDTTLMVRLPDGRVLCDDDSGGSLNPLIEASLPAGPVQVWVGSYSGSTGAYSLMVSGAGGGGAMGGGVAVGGPVGGGAPLFGVISYPAGGDPALAGGTYGGPIAASSLSPDCRGYISPAPSHVVQLTSYVPNLRFVVRGDGDSTLVVRYSDGRVACNDDGGGSLQPLVEGAAPPGMIQVWVGGYGAGSTGSYVLGVTANPSVRGDTLTARPPTGGPPGGGVVVTPPGGGVVVTPPGGGGAALDPWARGGAAASAVRVTLEARVPITLFGGGITPTVAVWSPRGGPTIEVSAMPRGPVLAIGALVGGASVGVAEVPTSLGADAIVTLTQRADGSVLVRAERAPNGADPGATMLWLARYVAGSGSVEVAERWSGSASERAPRWAR